MIVLARFAIKEALRRRVFTVVAILTGGFLVLYALGVWQASKISDDLGSGFNGVDPTTVVGATMFGLAMFATLFLGVVLAVFLTLGAIRGDAERGLLQPVLVRPISRRELFLARLLAAGGVSGVYVIGVYLLAMLLTGAIGGYWPGSFVQAGLDLALGVVIVTALSLAGSVVLSSTANGIAVFMAFGSGLTAGLLGQIGRALDSGTLSGVSDVVAHALPFEALYQAALFEITSTTTGFTGFALRLGPLGGAQEGGIGLWLWALAYLGLVTAAALAAFRRADL